MAIDFSKKIKVSPCDEPEVAATRLEAEVARLFAKDSQFAEWKERGAGWELRDDSSSTARGKTVAEVFGDFRSHGLQPSRLLTRKRGAAGPFGELGFWLHVDYSMNRNILQLEVWSRERVAVDGVAAFCERIRDRLEQPQEPNGDPMPAVVQSDPSWLARTWRDHTAALIVGILAAVIGAALALWLGLVPE